MKIVKQGTEHALRMSFAVGLFDPCPHLAAVHAEIKTRRGWRYEVLGQGHEVYSNGTCPSMLGCHPQHPASLSNSLHETSSSILLAVKLPILGAAMG